MQGNMVVYYSRTSVSGFLVERWRVWWQHRKRVHDVPMNTPVSWSERIDLAQWPHGKAATLSCPPSWQHTCYFSTPFFSLYPPHSTAVIRLAQLCCSLGNQAKDLPFQTKA
ncbi:hypothetical protein ATANTOWER_007938 [Ataeniobius toweri]|uniref:Uncharacterized protein n=1 Tax=Ataeniobius toweri TaxID=208326 RepID=A0ABU7A9W5_9TELE|nr:hypothetical protein [Ataeniobius toweri]